MDYKRQWVRDDMGAPHCLLLLSNSIKRFWGPDFSIFKTLIGELCLSKKAREASKLLSNMSDFGWPSQSTISFNILLHFLCKNTETLMAMAVLGRMLRLGGQCSPDVITFTTIISISNLHQSLILIEKRELFGIYPDVVTFSVIIKSLCSSGNSSTALKLVREKLCPMNVVTYSTLIHALCGSGAIDKALSLMKEMKVLGIYPNVVTYNGLIKGLCKYGKIVSAMEVLAEMKMQDSWCKPNAATFNTLINYFCEEGEIEVAVKLFEDMFERGISPTVISYGIMMKGLFSAGMRNNALLLLRGMCREGEALKPNLVSYSTVIDGFSNEGRVEEGVGILKEMVASGITPNVITYSSIIKGFCKVGRVETAVSLLREMMEQDKLLKPDVVTFTIVIDELGERGWVRCAVDLVREMKARGVELDVVVYNSLIKGFCKSGMINIALRLIREMAAEGCQPNLVTYTTIIDKLYQNGLFHDCVGLFEEMLNVGIVPDFVATRVLLKALSSKRSC